MLWSGEDGKSKERVHNSSSSQRISITFVANQVYFLYFETRLRQNKPLILISMLLTKTNIWSARYIYTVHIFDSNSKDIFIQSSYFKNKKRKQDKQHKKPFSWLTGFLDNVWQAHLPSPNFPNRAWEMTFLFCLLTQNNTSLCRELGHSHQI